jgi:hypothetical protein
LSLIWYHEAYDSYDSDDDDDDETIDFEIHTTDVRKLLDEKCAITTEIQRLHCIEELHHLN